MGKTRKKLSNCNICTSIKQQKFTKNKAFLYVKRDFWDYNWKN